MTELDQFIDRLLKEEEQRAEEAQRIRQEAGSTLCSNGGAVEEDLIHTVEPAGLSNITVAGVDGGLMRKAFHGMDLIMTRAVAAALTYEHGQLASHAYHPSKQPTPRWEAVRDHIDRTAVDRLATLHRLKEEVTAANSVVEEADLLLLDGAVIPQFRDKPGNAGNMGQLYTTVMDGYRELFNAAAEHDTLVAGIVEDTRGTRMCDVLRDNGFGMDALGNCRDTHLLQYLLRKGERTMLIPYAKNVATHPILTDLPQHKHQLYSFYLKTVKNDQPLRIDVYAPQNAVETTDTVASNVLSLSGLSDTYGIPAPIIEADKRAKLSQHELGIVTKRMQARLAHLPGMQELRRDRRPF